MDTTDIFLSAGDPSGDNAAARLVESLRQIKPECQIFGLGGNRLRKLGQHQLARPQDLAVLGFWEVAKRARFFTGLLSSCAREIEQKRPAAIILVDYPGFNLRLAKKIKHLSIPIIYYITPQVWAWGRKRVKDIRKLVDLSLVILPFEKPFFESHDINTEFVGHYLVEDIPNEYIASPVPDSTPPSLALLPGSRPQEIERMFAPMLEAARIFGKKYQMKVVVAAIKDVVDYESYLGGYADMDVTLSYDNSRRVVFDSTLVLTASGTATLETAIIGRPMVVIYKTGFLTYQIARRLVKLDKIALVNLVLDQKVVPELIQRQASPRRIADALEKLYTDSAYYQSVKAMLNHVPQLLGGEGASQRAARLIADRYLK
ncbi:MAG: lipid-A-disaccharide synthase [Candidatus Zixiibacteriota bacterium]